MAITSFGFTGSLNASTWAAGENYTSDVVKSATDMAVTVVGGARAVSVSAGEAFCAGVRVVNDAAATVTLGTPAAGQWFIVALRRDWTANTATFVAIADATTTTATPSVAPTSVSGTLNADPGVLTDQPLAWAWCSNTSTTVVLFDARQVVSDGLAEFMSTAGLVFMRNVGAGILAGVRGDQPYVYASGAWTPLASYATNGSATQASLNTETTNRTNGDNTLTSNLNAEITNRTNGDNTLTSNLNAEITNRQNGDNGVQGNLNNEITNRQNADNGIYSAYDNGRLDGRYPVARVAGGGVSVAGSGTASVTFPGGRFSSEPYITTGIFSGVATPEYAGISNATASGFTMYYYRGGSTASATINWIAVQ